MAVTGPAIDTNYFPTFSHAERDRRWRAARDLMAKRSMDCVIVFGNERLRINTYLSNDRLDLTVIFPREGKPIGLGWSTQHVTEHMESKRRGEDTWLEDIRHGARAEHIVAVVKELGYERPRIGVIGLTAAGLNFDGIVPFNTWQGILAGLPGATFEDFWADLRPVVLSKSPEELAVLRKAAEAGEAACAAIWEVTRPGVDEATLVAAAMNAIHTRGVRVTSIIIQSGPSCSAWGPPMWLVRPQRSRVIQRGDVINAELFPMYGMLEAQQQMCIAVGEVGSVNEKCAGVARRAYEIGLEVLRPGARFGEVVAAMEAPVREVGGWNLTPMIHTLNPLEYTGSVGVDIEKHLPGIEQYKNVRGRGPIGGEAEILEGMTFAFEPNCHIGSHRVNIGGTVVASGTGAMELNELPNNMQRVAA